MYSDLISHKIVVAFKASNVVFAIQRKVVLKTGLIGHMMKIKWYAPDDLSDHKSNGFEGTLKHTEDYN